MTTLYAGSVLKGDDNGVLPIQFRAELLDTYDGPGLLRPCVVTGSSSGPNMIYQIPPSGFLCEFDKDTDGLHRVTGIGTTLANSGEAAPGSGARYDLVYIQALVPSGDGPFGAGSSSQPVSGVAVGTSSTGTPTKPYDAVPGGSLIIAECHVGASIANAAAATITPVCYAKLDDGSVIPARYLPRRDLPIGTPDFVFDTIAPFGYVVAANTTLNQLTYAAAFAKWTDLGAPWLGASGSGDTATFQSPDARKSVLVGYDSSDSAFNSIGKTGGEKTHTLNSGEVPATGIRTELPSYKYAVPIAGTVAGGPDTLLGAVAIPVFGTMVVDGGGGAHNNLPPYITALPIVKI